MVRRRRRLLRLGAVLALAGLASTWLVGEALVWPSPAPVPASAPPALDFTLRSSDGLAIAATYRPGRAPGAPGVLLLHGNGASRAATAPNAEWLARHGYAVLTIDFRGHGRSAAARHSFGLYESRDAAAAFAWLKRRQGGARVAVVGISLGGAAALLGEHGPLPADAMVLQAVYPDIRHAIRNRIAAFTTAAPAALLEPLLSYQSRLRLGVWPGRLAPLEAARRYRGAALVVGGGADAYTPPAETRALFAALPGPKRLWFAPGLAHAEVSDTASPGYRARLLAFLQVSLGRP